MAGVGPFFPMGINTMVNIVKVNVMALDCMSSWMVLGIMGNIVVVSIEVLDILFIVAIVNMLSVCFQDIVLVGDCSSIRMAVTMKDVGARI